MFLKGFWERERERLECILCLFCRSRVLYPKALQGLCWVVCWIFCEIWEVFTFIHTYIELSRSRLMSRAWWSLQLLFKELKENTSGCACIWWSHPRKKEFLDSELARGRVSKFYWWVAIRSRAWGLVCLIVWTSILSR